MMQQPPVPPGGILLHKQYGYQQPFPYGMAGAAPPQMWNLAPPSSQPMTADEICTLWIGDLQFWLDENFLFGWFAHTGEAADPSQYYYSGYIGQGQEHYGYLMPQDPNAYYGGHPGGYQQPPQQQQVGFIY